MSDKMLQCKDCGNSFVFTEGEQQFYQSRGFSEPSRCPDCRAARKQNRGGGARGGGAGGRPRAARKLYPAVCAECGQETMVPFEPRGDRPVYCQDCFQAKRA